MERALRYTATNNLEEICEELEKVRSFRNEELTGIRMCVQAFRQKRAFILTVILIAVLLSPPYQLAAQSSAMRKANTEYKLNQFSLAIESYLAVLEKDPKNADAQARIADCYRMTNDLENAAEWYKEAVDHRNVDPIHVFNYAGVLKSLQQYDKARRQYLNYAEDYPGIGQHYAASCLEGKALANTEPRYDVRLEYINSAFSELFPTMSGDAVVFASSRTDIVRDNQRLNIRLDEGVENQLFSSTRDEKNFLLKPEFYHPEVRHDKNEGPLSFSADGKWVAFTRNNFREGVRPVPGSGLELSIYIAYREADGSWAEARPFPHNGTGYSTGFPCFADNGNTLYFASDRPDGYGGFDLFVSKRTADGWSAPANLGPVVNTPGHELAPFHDGESLYFSSDWHFGLGGFDLFRVTFENGGWNRVFNMGTGVNSSYDDLSIVYDPELNLGYLTSNRPGGKGSDDIYHFRTKTDEITFRVTDALTRAPFGQVSIDLSACGEEVIQTDLQGMAVVRLPAGFDCEVIITAPGCAPFSFSLKEGDFSGDRRFDVVMEREADRFFGRVINSLTNQSEAGVVVRLSNDLTGDLFETLTNPNGEYSLALAPNTTYTLTYSKAGFFNINNKISTGSRTDRSLLGTVAIREIAASGKRDQIDSSEEKIQSAQQTDPSGLSRGFAVQVATVSSLEEVKPEEYERLRSFGNIYSNPEGRTKKIRVGIFTDRAEAERVQNAINALGFSTAFVVEETITTRNRNILLGMPPEAPTSSSVQPGTVEPAEGPVYLVRLATYTRPEFFNPKLVAGLGTVERMKKGDMTIMLLRGYSSLEDAREVVAKVISAGFDTAHIVVEADGGLKRVE